MPRETLSTEGIESQRRYFGRRLVQLRETFSQRTAKNGASGVLLRAEPTAKAMVECLNAYGYSISPATYSEIENGQVLPRDGAAFVDAIAKCLVITEPEKKELIQRLAYDILYSRLGSDANKVINPARWGD
ncbi:MAG TPA: hypothetical protein VF120_17895 [Ktedonobacterales bacterium]